MERIRSLDLARGFTVLFIAPIHTVMLYSNNGVYKTMLGCFLQFIAEGPGAQLFMTLMGMYIAFKPVADSKAVLRRSIMLLLAGYALNMAKFVLPMFVGIIPIEMQQDLGVQDDCAGMLQLFCIGDILQFAAPALVITHWVRRKKYFGNNALALAPFVLLLSPFLWDATSNNFVVNYFLELIGGQPPKVFFPLLPCLFYPLLGLFLGKLVMRDREMAYREMLKWGTAWLLFGIIAHYMAGIEASFYRAYPWDTVGHAGLVLITLYVWEWLDRYITPNPFFYLLEYCSRNITTIYVVQWILIIWLLPFFGYQELGYYRTLMAIVITSSLTFLITLIINKLKKN
jgi:hypothetical protein